MLVEQMTTAAGEERGVTRWLFDRAVHELRQLWACWWWMLRVHVAARHGIPRDGLEEPPHAWMKVMQGPGDKDRSGQLSRARA
ncbi:MAG: hypothetical protein ACREEO_13915 [Phenylobacterium sp.]